MFKQVMYQEKEYTIEFAWNGNAFCLRAVGISGFITIPKECWGSIEKIKPTIIQAINHVNESAFIEEWDGKID